MTGGIDPLFITFEVHLNEGVDPLAAAEELFDWIADIDSENVKSIDGYETNHDPWKGSNQPWPY